MSIGRIKMNAFAPYNPTKTPHMADVPNANQFFRPPDDRTKNIRGAICKGCGKCVVNNSRNMFWHFIVCKYTDKNARRQLLPKSEPASRLIDVKPITAPRRRKVCEGSSGRNVRSSVWQWFNFNNNVSECIYCKKRYSGTSGVSTLKQHLILCTLTPMEVKYELIEV